MRTLLLKALPILLLAGCGRGDCLPAPDADATPPGIRLTVEYPDPATGEPARRTLTAGEAAVTVDAAEGPITVTYVAEDDAGLRRLQLGVTIQQTAGAGVERRSIAVGPVTASCPLPRLEETWSYQQPGAKNLILGAVAENWAGGRAASENFTVRQRSATP